MYIMCNIFNSGLVNFVMIISMQREIQNRIVQITRKIMNKQNTVTNMNNSSVFVTSHSQGTLNLGHTRHDRQLSNSGVSTVTMTVVTVK